MEKFEEQAIQRYTNNKFVVEGHRRDELKNFLQHLNSIHPKIQFTMETKQTRWLTFFDVLVFRGEGLTLGHEVFRKATHADYYLDRDSNHHPRQKQGVIKTQLVPGELLHLDTAL